MPKDSGAANLWASSYDPQSQTLIAAPVATVQSAAQPVVLHKTNSIMPQKHFLL